MTREQFDRWLDFACRMAKTCHKRNKRVLEHVGDFIKRYADKPERVIGWDGGHDIVCINDEISEYLYDRGMDRDSESGPKYTPTGQNISGCVRAGLDVASHPSGGVIGYTVGDLRRMYPEGLPDWVIAFFGKGAKRKLQKAKDDDGVWL